MTGHLPRGLVLRYPDSDILSFPYAGTSIQIYLLPKRSRNIRIPLLRSFNFQATNI